MNVFQRILYRPFFIRLLHWEYWSFNTVYSWIMPIWALLALRARSLFFFAASNPSIEFGGFLMESKKKIYDIMPQEYYPATLYFSAATSNNEVLNKFSQAGFTYPIIAKPDVGGRGRGVKKIYNQEELLQYAQTFPIDYLVQECVPYENEVGVFYYRYPNETSGHISGIVRKELLGVTGDGRSTIHELLMQDKRAILQLKALQQVYGEGLNEILPAGERKELVPYGTHARGSKFLDDSHLADDVFTKTIDDLCKRVQGFFYGRLDIRFNNWEELREGKNFSIIEINGAGSEPTHMYDPKHSLLFGWKEIIRHWVILWRISRINHKKGVPYLSFKEGRQMMKDDKLFAQKMEQLYV
ncbi:MAG: hypothetical protein QM726_13740 [Chitinophagaceae bacterium]